jgi:aminopeptidase
LRFNVLSSLYNALAMTSSLQAQQQRYAELLVKVGLNLQPGQGLFIQSEIVHRPFVQLVVAEAYKAGAKYVELALGDPINGKSRFQHAAPDTLEYVPDWSVAQHRQMVDEGWARLALTGEEFPGLMDDIDPSLMRRAAVSRSRKLKFYSEAIMSMQMQWCVAAMPTANWAKKMFPDLPVEEAIAKLWQLILAAVRVDQADPVALWWAHDERLKRISSFMKARQVRAVRFVDATTDANGQPLTDLTVGLLDASQWLAASSDTPKGVRFFPNMPTEEIFTTPHRLRVNGYARMSKPGFPLGRQVDDALFRFKDGELIEFQSTKGEDILRQMFDMRGAKYLGEVALVDARSPINQSGALFYNTLFDENAASHIAFGRAYADAVEGGTAMSEAERETAGINDSDTHCDLMIGTPTMRVIGICADGSEVTVMENGQFVAIDH